MPEAPVLTHLVYLDVDDEITSAAARIRTTEAPQITLVLPYGSRLATSRINFRLLAREAAARGTKLDIVCADASARALAAAAGLPVHASVAAYEAGRRPKAAADPAVGNGSEPASSAAAAALGLERTGQLQLPELADEDDPTTAFTVPRKRAPRVPIVGPARPPVSPRIAVAAGTAVVAAVLILGLLGMQLLPAATIVLHPRSEQVGPLQLTVQARTDVTAPDPVNLVIPAQRFTFPLEASQTITATGTKVEDVKATGEVVFSNFDNGTGVYIPKGTIVRTRGPDRVEFATLEDLTLPKAQVDFFPPFSTHPSTGTIGIEAVVPGVDGNVGNNTITDIPQAGKLLRANNPDPTSGGAHTESPQITQDDVDLALTGIDQALAADLDEQLQDGTDVPDAITLLAQTQAVGDPAFETDPQTLVGSTETSVEVNATAEGSIVGVDRAPIQGMAESRLATAVDGGWTLADGSTTFDLGDPIVFGDVISFSVTVGAIQVRQVDRDALLAQVRGLTAAQARSRLEAYGSVELSLWPDWVTAVPPNDDRIDFTIGDPQPAPSPTP
jgi:hypothetical protein